MGGNGHNLLKKSAEHTVYLGGNGVVSCRVNECLHGGFHCGCSDGFHRTLLDWETHGEGQ